MAETGGFSVVCKIVAFVVSFMYRITVTLAVEFAKIFILLAILIATLGVFGFAYVSFVAWAYVSYNSLQAAIGAVFLGALLFLFTAAAIQYLVKDVLCLTNQPLHQLVMICINSLTRSKPSPGQKDGRSDAQQEEPSVTQDERVEQTKKEL